MFNIFINDIIKASSKFDFILYADDTTLVSTLESFGTLNNVAELENAINCEISKISSWLVSNMLVLNVEHVEEFNFLGITVDQNVNWDAHITKISIKLARVIGILHKLKRTFPQHILRTIYNSLIHPHFIYGLYLWGLKCRRIKVLQKKAVRILAFKPYISHSTPIFKTLQILKIEDLYTIQLYKLYYKLRNNLLPSYFHTFIPYYHNDQHTHDLRYTILRLPMTRREYFAECTKYQFLKLIRETSQTDLDRSTQSTIFQFASYFEYSLINGYTTVCNVTNCYVCG